jgi:hypothetical protein
LTERAFDNANADIEPTKKPAKRSRAKQSRSR